MSQERFRDTSETSFFGNMAYDQAVPPGHDRVQFHPIPTYSSWLNLVEIFFNLLQAKVIRRGNFTSQRELVQRILRYIKHFNVEGRVFHWTKPAASILLSLNYETRQ